MNLELVRDFPIGFTPLFVFLPVYKKDLEKDVMSDTSGHFKRLLVSQLAASREEPTSVDTCKADQDADDFFKVCTQNIS